MDKLALIQRIESLSDRDTKVLERIVETLENMKTNKYPFLGNFLNLSIEPSDDPKSVFICSMPITRELLNPYRIVYGGITATLADMAMAWMLELHLADSERDKFITLDMHINYHHAGTGKQLIATTRVLNRARDVLQMSCEIHNDRGDLVATSTGTFMQLRRE